MPRPSTYWPPGDLRIALAEARERGLDFDAAWVEALGRVEYPRGGGTTDPSGRFAWRDALDATRREWEAAYNREPSPGGEALGALLGAVDAAGSALPERYAAA